MKVPSFFRKLAFGLVVLSTSAPVFAIGFDTTYNPQIPAVGWESYRCMALAVEADGRILSGGSAGLVRLEPSGALVPGLAPTFAINGQPHNFIFQIVVLDDGDIVVTGDFNEVNGQSRPGLARLNADGSLDGSPAVLLEDGERVSRIHASTGGSYFLGTRQDDHPVGPFFYSGNLRRVLANGTIDPTFVLDLSSGPGQPTMLLPEPQAMVTDALGRIYVGGAAVGESEESAYNPAVARLLPSGQRDPAWDGQLSGAFNPVSALRLEPGGGLIVGGEYRGLGRLDSEGVFDGAYDENTGWIDQADDPYPVGIVPAGSSGRVVAVGTRMDTALVNADGSLVQTFTLPPGFFYVSDAVVVDGAIMIAVGTTFLRFDLDEEGFHFATDRIAVSERARRLVPLKVQRSGDASLPASVQIAVGPGTATIFRDWALFGLGADLRRTLHFPAGVRSRTVYLAVWDDRVAEGLETASFFLTRPIGAPFASPDAVVVEISD